MFATLSSVACNVSPLRAMQYRKVLVAAISVAIQFYCSFALSGLVWFP